MGDEFDPAQIETTQEYVERMAEHMLAQLHRQYMTTAMLWEQFLAREAEIIAWRDRRFECSQMEMEFG